MKTAQRTITVYLDMMPQDNADSCAYCVPHVIGGDNRDSYVPPVSEGCIRNRIEVNVTVPIKNEMVKLSRETAEVVESEVFRCNKCKAIFQNDRLEGDYCPLCHDSNGGVLVPVESEKGATT